VSIQERDWYQRDQRAKEYKAAGVKYKNSQGWYYRLNGYDFGPCDKDNICRLMREHRLDDSSLVKHGSGEWMQISKLRKEFPKGGYIYSSNKAGKNSSGKKFPLSVFGCVLAIVSLIVGVKVHYDVGGIIFGIVLSLLMTTIIKAQWRKKRSFTAGALIAAVVLVIYGAYLGVLISEMI
jgi:hypothetical protein